MSEGALRVCPKLPRLVGITTHTLPCPGGAGAALTRGTEPGELRTEPAHTGSNPGTPGTAKLGAADFVLPEPARGCEISESPRVLAEHLAFEGDSTCASRKWWG